MHTSICRVTAPPLVTVTHCCCAHCCYCLVLTVVVSSCCSCDTNCITNPKPQVEWVVWLQMCGGSLEPQGERLHPKHKNTLGKINQLMGGRGKHDEQRAAKVSDGQWRDAVSQLQVFVRAGGPVSGNTQHHEVRQAVFCTLQRALQSGPLGGGKPGHFGRKVSPGKTHLFSFPQCPISLVPGSLCLFLCVCVCFCVCFILHGVFIVSVFAGS